MRQDESASAPELESTFKRLVPRLVIGAILAILALSALTVFADVRELGDALAGFAWWLVVPVLGLTLLNYALRLVKWELYLRRIAVPKLPLGTSLLVFLSAFSMSITPGKVGEVIKAVYVRRLTGTPVSRTAAVIAAERVTDGLAMIALGAIGLTQFSYGRPLIGVAAFGGLVIVLIFRRPVLLHRLARKLERVPVVGPLVRRTVHHVEHFLDASNALYEPRLLVGSILLGMVSWFCECVALFLVLIGLGLDPSWQLLLIATFVLSVSSVFGALSMLPGGLGVAEASVTGMLILLIDDAAFNRGDAVAATLLIRFATLWFGVLLGFVALAVLQRRVAQEVGSTTQPIGGFSPSSSTE